MDIKRVTSALLGFPLVIVVLLFGNKYIIDAVMAIVAIISLQEYFNAFKVLDFFYSPFSFAQDMYHFTVAQSIISWHDRNALSGLELWDPGLVTPSSQIKAFGL